MIEFYQTGMGRKYYEHDLPELNRQLKRIADQLEKHPSIFIEPQQPPKLSTSKMSFTNVKSESEVIKKRFRDPNEEELKLLLERQINLMYGKSHRTEAVDKSEAQDTLNYSTIVAIDYISDCPGDVGSLIFISYGAGMEYYEVLSIKNGKLEVVEQAEELMEQNKSDKVVIDKNLIENMSEKEAAEFITKLVPEAKIAKKDNLPSTIKMRRMSVEQSLKETDWLNDNGDDGSAFGAVVAVYAIELDSKVYGELYITEYESGQFWTCMHNGDEAGTLTKCIQFLQEQA